MLNEDRNLGEHAFATRTETRPESRSRKQPSVMTKGAWRHALGISLMLATVILWTATNFLASNIFADKSYAKPYFVIYVNTAFFALPLLPFYLHRRIQATRLAHWPIFKFFRDSGNRRLRDGLDDAAPKPARQAHHSATERQSLLGQRTTEFSGRDSTLPAYPPQPLTIRETAKISLYFCFTWFIANYFTAACLEYTTVASATILTSTSSVWTLITSTALRVERLTAKKILGVLASFLGILLISRVDVSGQTNKNRGSFPYKSRKEIAVGDIMALLSAALYGFYTVFLKKKVGDESRVSMPLLFAFVGLFNIVFFWPGLIFLHLTGIEEFELPPTKRILAIVLINAVSSLVADVCWAYAMLLTSPLVATVGLSLTIPLSLVGQILLDSEYSSPLYWFGASVVVLSFVLISLEGDTSQPAAARISSTSSYAASESRLET